MTVESTELDVGANLSRVRGEVDAAARMVERDPKTITVCAVSKTHGPARIRDVIAAGHRVFGENRVQEAESKWPELKAETANIELHLIGPLQTNKVRKALALFDVVQTVDRPKLARALAREMARLDRRIPCYVQVNTGDEPQKAGVRPDDADAFIETCLREHNLPILGLMCIPPAAEESALHFALLRDIADRHGLTRLSMGMSADYETAITFGATIVRVGTAIFGPRASLNATAAA